MRTDVPTVKSSRKRGRPTERQADGDGPPELLTEAEWGIVNVHLGLTPRQSDAARLICRGCDYSTIARHMGISVNTVRMHMHLLFLKVDVHDRVGLILAVLSAHRAATRAKADGLTDQNHATGPRD